MKYKSLIAAFFVPLFLYVAVFAQSAVTGTVLKNANLRAGPGTNYAIVGTVKAGQVITITEKNTAGTWYHLKDGQWIATFLVKVNGLITTTATPAPATGGTAQPSATPTVIPTSAPIMVPPTATPIPPAPTPKPVANCDPSYPTVCIPPYPPDLNCGDIPYKRFKVIGADPHGFDRDNDGIGCEK